MRKITTTALSVALATSLSIWGVSPAIAAEEIEGGVDCAPCHGDAHKTGDENPHGYPTANAETTSNNKTSDKETSENTTDEKKESTKEVEQADTEKTDSKTTNTKDSESADENTSQSAAQTNSSYTPLDENLTLETINEAIEEEYTSRINTLKTEAEALISELNTPDAYIANSDKVKDFYQQIIAETNTLCILMKEYALRYAELILASDLSDGDKQDTLDGIYDYIYEDAADEIYDEIYDTILDDLYDAFYDGVLDNRPDSISYEEWDYITTDEYNQLDYTRDIVYFLRNRLSSDVYKFRSNLRTALYNSDTERAQNKIDEFKESIENAKQLSGLTNTGSNITQTDTANTPDAKNTEAPTVAGASQEEKNELLAYLDKWDAQAAENHKVDPYTEESYKTFNEASQAAREVINENKSTSEDLQAAQKTYDDAWYKLTTVSSNDYGVYSYTDIARTPEEYEGIPMTFSGKVVQVINGDDEIQLRVATDGSYGDVILVGYSSDLLNWRVLEDDMITIYGTCLGLYTYQSTLKGAISIPAIYADGIVLSE